MEVSDPQMTDRAARFAKFSRMLAAQGLRPALADLLMATDYRFIAIFRFNGDRATAAVFYDRENPAVLRVDEVPAKATYCCYARDAKGAFVTANALLDARLQGHVAREHVQAYCGVPIMTPEGEILGTLCHYDLVPRDPAQIDLELLCEIASALEQGAHVPPYPGL
ncbi:GAF domain-containing protein [Variovorax sp. HJSM1_2]|uniref:GAF domain-containing protein n=1 Tax=Variovorax sp. HJSM1_2 TaxID=3366263 RepID=UPI003BEE301D